MKENNIYEMKVSRTLQLIKDTFIQLLNEKSFEKITVRDLTSKAQLSRGTFYLHYLDKYDLMDAFLTENILKRTELPVRKCR